ncbi:MAG: CidA/LrgA family protein [Bacteroidales bacterium]|nr:CidA/LrgA family protein [Candidatus Cacconaster merdequi]
MTSAAIGNYIPGNVIGMIFLFIALCCKIIKPKWIRETTEFLTRNMVIFFVPLFMSLMDEWDILKLDFWSWIFILFVTTIIVMLSAGGSAELLSKIKRRKTNE